MANGDFFSIHIGMNVIDGLALRQMSNDLMAKQIEIDPLIGAAPFGAPQKTAIKVTGGL
jgi:hypothetical protein